MKPVIDETILGEITVEGKTFEHDIIIRLTGEIIPRDKELSKPVQGSWHSVSLNEVKYVYEEGASCMIVGAGQSGLLALSEEAEKYLKDKKCRIEISPTYKAIKHWNEAKTLTVALFHVTC